MLVDAAVTACEAVHTPNTGRQRAAGGGIFAAKRLTLTRSLVSNNAATGTGSEGAWFSAFALGGGVYAGSTATLADSTISGNRVVSGDSGPPLKRADGSGLYLRGDVVATNIVAKDNFAGCGTSAATYAVRFRVILSNTGSGVRGRPVLR